MHSFHSLRRRLAGPISRATSQVLSVRRAVSTFLREIRRAIRWNLVVLGERIVGFIAAHDRRVAAACWHGSGYRALFAGHCRYRRQFASLYPAIWLKTQFSAEALAAIDNGRPIADVLAILDLSFPGARSWLRLDPRVIPVPDIFRADVLGHVGKTCTPEQRPRTIEDWEAWMWTRRYMPHPAREGWSRVRRTCIEIAALVPPLLDNPFGNHPGPVAHVRLDDYLAATGQRLGEPGGPGFCRLLREAAIWGRAPLPVGVPIPDIWHSPIKRERHRTFTFEPITSRAEMRRAGKLLDNCWQIRSNPYLPRAAMEQGYCVLVKDRWFVAVAGLFVHPTGRRQPRFHVIECSGRRNARIGPSLNAAIEAWARGT